MPSTLPLFLVLLWLSLAGSIAAAPTVILSSNVTSLEFGKPAKLTCQVDNFTPGNGGYWVRFANDDDADCFFHYIISAPDSSGKRTISFENHTSSQRDLGRHPLSSTFPVYEITGIATIASTKKYWCRLYRDSSSPYLDVHSNHLSLTATPPPPSAVLSSTVSFPLLAQPFTLTCTFVNFTTPPAKYSVQFSNSRDGQLAVFEVTNGNVLLSDELHSQVEVLPGPESAFPSFHLVLKEKVEVSSSYWCALVEAGKAPVTSQPWPILVNLVKFTESKVAEKQRVGTCTVGATGLDLSGKTYSVQFRSDLGAEAVNLLGKYIFRPNLFDEFKSNPLPPWTSIRHGPSISWPEFSLLATGTGTLNGTWWCVLAIGEQGTPDYREITSEKVDL